MGKYVIVEKDPLGNIYGVFGPFDSRHDEKLKKIMVEKNFIPEYLEVIDSIYENPNGYSVIVCKVNSNFSEML